MASSRWPARSEERRVGKEWRYWRDWSSDVCSSDLCGRVRPVLLGRVEALRLGVAVRRLDRGVVAFDAAAAQSLGQINQERGLIRSRGETLLVLRDGLVEMARKIGRASCRERVEILA